ncbi:MBL fold metallo-hydrolase [Limnochorda pilosa]|uniref:Beta-lactamase n=1 Tax=Limnochorda pilosa TaxID=1555112 RepID=A0A0K2SQ29_LIMPI|nr:MBL fold metallo-hydrolase [Limnochorda pilosa]BAS29225.1 beta-lactamase [Limnochorda pilosa]
MIFRQIHYGPSGCASYFLGCPKAKEAVVVDPVAGVGMDEYLMEAADRGVTIRHVIDTHVHADHVSLGRELAEATGAAYYLGEHARGLVRFDFTPLADGQVLQVGAVQVKALYTPGHTPEHVCLLVTDTARSDEPWFVLTGDTLFVGDVARPDLLVGDRSLDVWDARERAEHLYESLTQRLLALPDHVEVYPGHFGGSACGGVNMSGKAASTLAYERRFNLALQQPDAERFAEFVVSTLKPLPHNYQNIKRRNLGLEAG